MADEVRELFAPDKGVTDEDNWGNLSYLELSPEERRKSVERIRARDLRFTKAAALRENWTPEQFAEEEARLRAEIDAWTEGQQDAA